MAEGQTEIVEKPAAETAPVAEKPAVETNTGATQAAEKPQTGEQPKLKPADFFKQREEKREKKATERVAELEKQLAELEAAKKPESPVSLLDDPDKWAQSVEERAEKRVMEKIQAREADNQYRQSAESAANWLLTRSHLKQDSNLTKEVAGVIQDKYAHIASVDPNGAARLAYIDVCAAKGISPDMDGFKPGGFDGTGGSSTSGARPSAAASGKRIFRAGEADAYVFGATPGTPEYSKRLAEVEEAHSEGRIR